MKCPFCANGESKVIDSRPVPEGNSIRRRRECLGCQKRFTTFEMIETAQIIVIKKNCNDFIGRTHSAFSVHEIGEHFFSFLIFEPKNIFSIEVTFEVFQLDKSNSSIRL